MTDLRVIEICAGAGGQALGLERAGFEHELAIELDNNAANTLKANRPRWTVLQGDVADPAVWNPTTFAPVHRERPVDLLAGGVPCPPFSIAGKQLGARDERDLFAWAVEQLAIIKPRALLLENVRGLSMPRFTGYRQHVFDRLRELGYIGEWRLVQAADFGVPQLRPRFVLVAMRPKEFSRFRWPTPKGAKATVGETLRELMIQKSVFGDNDPQNQKLLRWIENANDIGPTIVGGSKKHGGADLGPSRAKQRWAELGVDAHGIVDDNDEYIPGTRAITARGPKLTPAMVARLQGWDDSIFNWTFTGGKTSKYRQIGNAFPPPVAFALGTEIARALTTTDTNDQAKALEQEAPEAPADMIDPIYHVLRRTGKFMTAFEISDAIGHAVDEAEIVRRTQLLGRDFEIEYVERGGQAQYKLGQFHAFTGQDDHTRHHSFKKNRSKIS